MITAFPSPFVGANAPDGGGASAATALTNVSELHHDDLLFSHPDPPPPSTMSRSKLTTTPFGRVTASALLRNRGEEA